MTIKKKLKFLTYVREVLEENLSIEQVFICNAFNNFHYSRSNYIIEDFPELVAQIIKVGEKHNSIYRFPTALSFIEDGVLKMNISTPEEIRIYNTHKLELISRVLDELTKNK